MTPSEYGQHLASLTPPITEAVAEAAARILVNAERERAAA